MFPGKVLWDAVSQPFKRSQLGLFQGKMKQYGNNVPFSKHKTRRSWLPNVQQKRIPSEVMGTIRLKLTTRALRTIKKKGGLDNYLKTTSAELLGYAGMKLRTRMRDEELKSRGKEPKQYELLPIEEYQAKVDGAPTLPLGLHSRPNLQTARLARMIVAEKAGETGQPASANDTIEFLKERKSKREGKWETPLSPSSESSSTTTSAPSV